MGGLMEWLAVLLYVAAYALAALAAGVGALAMFYRARRARETTPVVAFFHPYSNAGGGGERVLWSAVAGVQQKYGNGVHLVVYTGAETNGDHEWTPEEIMARVRRVFGVSISPTPEFVFLRRRTAVEARLYPLFTLLGQSLGSLVLGWEALHARTPHIVLDTMGYAFTYPLFALLGGCTVGSYTHYPTISTDMLSVVSKRQAAFNNRAIISRWRALSWGKLQYYRLFAAVYGAVGRFASVVMVNSSWTLGHIVSLWRHEAATFLVFPPCDTTALQRLPLDSASRGAHEVVSIGQFRPEKNHMLQVRAVHDLITRHKHTDVHLTIVGATRGAEDQARADAVQAEVDRLQLGKHITLATNVPYAALQEYLQHASIGMHTMTNEHFGICVVEYMAAGCVPLAHDSAGPRMDIVVSHHGHTTGLLADTAAQYSDALLRLLTDHDERRTMQKWARERVVAEFSEEAFQRRFVKCVDKLVAPLLR